MGPYDELVDALDGAADTFGTRKIVIWCMEWAIGRIIAEHERAQVFACSPAAIDESAGVGER